MTGGFRSIPAPMIDLIRDGVPAARLRERGGAAVWGALVSTAMSAAQAGWTFPHWAGLVSETRSLLGRQARLDRGRRDIGSSRYERTLRRAWEAAERAVAESPALTAEEIREAVSEVLSALDATAWAGRSSDLAVLRWVLAEAGRRGMTRPACPARAVEAGSGVPRTEVSRALARLCADGWIERHSRGRRGVGGSGRASLYTVRPARLIALLSGDGATHMPEPPTGAYVPESPAPAPPMSQAGAGALVPDRPPMSQTSEESPMIAVTADPATGRVTALVPPGELPAAIRASLEALRGAGVEVREAPTPAQSAEVVDLAQHRAATGR